MRGGRGGVAAATGGGAAAAAGGGAVSDAGAAGAAGPAGAAGGVTGTATDPGGGSRTGGADWQAANSVSANTPAATRARRRRGRL
jgi:hypothetical protein